MAKNKMSYGASKKGGDGAMKAPASSKPKNIKNVTVPEPKRGFKKG